MSSSEMAIRQGTLATLQRAQPPGQGQEGLWGDLGQHGHEVGLESAAFWCRSDRGAAAEFAGLRVSSTCFRLFAQCLQHLPAVAGFASVLWLSAAGDAQSAASTSVAWVFASKYAVRLKAAIRRSHLRGMAVGVIPVRLMEPSQFFL